MGSLCSSPLTASDLSPHKYSLSSEIKSRMSLYHLQAHQIQLLWKKFYKHIDLTSAPAPRADSININEFYRLCHIEPNEFTIHLFELIPSSDPSTLAYVSFPEFVDLCAHVAYFDKKQLILHAFYSFSSPSDGISPDEFNEFLDRMKAEFPQLDSQRFVRSPTSPPLKVEEFTRLFNEEMTFLVPLKDMQQKVMEFTLGKSEWERVKNTWNNYDAYTAKENARFKLGIEKNVRRKWGATATEGKTTNNGGNRVEPVGLIEELKRKAKERTEKLKAEKEAAKGEKNEKNDKESEGHSNGKGVSPTVADREKDASTGAGTMRGHGKESGHGLVSHSSHTNTETEKDKAENGASPYLGSRKATLKTLPKVDSHSKESATIPGELLDKDLLNPQVKERSLRRSVSSARKDHHGDRTSGRSSPRKGALSSTGSMSSDIGSARGTKNTPVNYYNQLTKMAQKENKEKSSGASAVPVSGSPAAAADRFDDLPGPGGEVLIKSPFLPLTEPWAKQQRSVSGRASISYQPNEAARQKTLPFVVPAMEEARTKNAEVQKTLGLRRNSRNDAPVPLHVPAGFNPSARRYSEMPGFNRERQMRNGEWDRVQASMTPQGSPMLKPMGSSAMAGFMPSAYSLQGSGLGGNPDSLGNTRPTSRVGLNAMVHPVSSRAR